MWHTFEPGNAGNGDRTCLRAEWQLRFGWPRVAVAPGELAELEDPMFLKEQSRRNRRLHLRYGATALR